MRPNIKPNVITLTINTIFSKVKDGAKVVPDYLKKQHCEEDSSNKDRDDNRCNKLGNRI